ncbi:MAG TPA: type 4a pilus biogenesis protein PilO [Opitutaceae bacterium]
MNAADFMQWIATARKNPLSTLCATVCLICLGVCWYVYTNMKWLDLEHKQLLQDADLQMTTMISGPSVRQERLAALEVTRRIEDNLVIEDNLAENLWYFYKVEQQTKVHIAELRPANSVVSDSRALYKRVPFSIRITGTYEQTGAFLYAIETGPRLAYITSLSYRRAEPGGTAVILEMSVELLGKK